MAGAGSRVLGVREMCALLGTCVRCFVQQEMLCVVSRSGGGGYFHRSVPGSFPLHTYWHAAVKLRGLVVLLCRGDLGVHTQCL